MPVSSPVQPERSVVRAGAEIELPAPTAWPMVLSAGVALMFAGLLTAASLSALGVVLAVAGCVGWFREVLPRPHEETVAIERLEPFVAVTARRTVERLPITAEQVRAWLPVHTYPVASGIRGGWAGGAAMAVLACAYGVINAGSLWYPINILASVVHAQAVKLDAAGLNAFHADAFAVALLLHGLGSTLVGILYGAMLPMLPRRPIVLGGLVAPALWSGALYSIAGFLNPVLQARIDWSWFMASQVAFGIVAGLVVVRSSRLPTRENIAFALRAGVEAPGILPARGEEGSGR
jgi:hypothetical protein